MPDKKIGFKTVILFKDETLGIGSYGAVCKAKCDDLLCAAKIIHPTLFDPTALHQIAPHREHRLPIRRFQLECEFLSTVRHPNIVQYLGTHQDPNTGLPVLLMELMDDSLTHYLEISTQPIPYHIQVNICHDIALALSFLHSNDIIHRDLSSNNVLLIGNIRAKVTDFGMARLGDLNLHGTHVTNTMCPGTDVYMPPEAVQDKPVYTKKIDCFSFGVVTVQTLTREFPKPGDRQVTVDDPRYPQGALKLCVPEIERRQNHISGVDPNHPLLLIALSCLKDSDNERPSAQQLCERVATLKETTKYKNACERAKNSSACSGKDREYEQLRNVIDQIEGEKNQAIQEKERQLERVSQQLEESERQIADFGKRHAELVEQLSVLRNQVLWQDQDSRSKAEALDKTYFKLRWREGEKAPCELLRYSDAVVGNNTVYCRYHDEDAIILYAYHIPSSNWSPIPGCPINGRFAISVVDSLLTTVGGFGDDIKNTNQLFSLTGEGSDRRWTEKFPPMPTKRYCVGALCTGTVLIVVGGYDDKDQILKTVEVLNTETRQWHTAPDLPKPLANPSLTLCGDLCYLLGGRSKNNNFTNSVYFCSLSSLLLSSGSKSLGRLVSTLSRSNKDSLWNVAYLPAVKHSTAVTLHGKLLAIGGEDSKIQPTTAVRMYQPATNSWEIISHMTTPRSDCLAAVLPDNQLMVMGGWTTDDKKCDSVEFGRLV